MLIISIGSAVGVGWAWREAVHARNNAVVAAEEERIAKQREIIQRKATQRQLAQLYSLSGQQHLDQGDLLGSLVWFAAALKEEDDGAP